MTHIRDEPETFAETALAGFCALHPGFVRPVPGGAIRATATPEGKVALVVGGGSGHYPAFSGYVGPGLADAVVAGDVFTSPSTAAIARIGRRADRGGGVLFGLGNYAGDVLNFGAAAERLAGEGIDARCLIVTDDVASAGPDEKEKRRGVAGDVPVFKIAGAAAEAGCGMDEVVRLAEAANARTVSIGIAFAGCTLPGSTEPLFTVARGRMGVGLGIHGEPGIGEVDRMDAHELAGLLLERLLPESPPGWNRRAAVILNGLGATKYEELFVLWTHLARAFEAAGIALVEPEAGELVTSLDMAGCSLTLTFLDEELEPLWRAPAHAPAYRKGKPGETRPAAPLPEFAETVETFPPASEHSRNSGERIAALLEALREMLESEEERLGHLDAPAGDGDHGHGMRRGAMAAAAGEAWADRAGGTSGAIWGLILGGFASRLSDDAPLSLRAVPLPGAGRPLTAARSVRTRHPRRDTVRRRASLHECRLRAASAGLA